MAATHKQLEALVVCLLIALVDGVPFEVFGLFNVSVDDVVTPSFHFRRCCGGEADGRDDEQNLRAAQQSH